jgi:hypothetical protein
MAQQQQGRTVGEALETYAEALRERREAQARVRALAERLREMAAALETDPLWVAPKHPEANAHVPLHVMTGPVRREADLADWPDAGAILDALAALHASHARAQAMYSWLLPEDRERVEAP